MAQYKIFDFGGLEYRADCHYNKNDFITINIRMQSLDAYDVSIMIGTKKEYVCFINMLNLLKDKMIEWDSICVKNNISTINKNIPYKYGKKEIPSILFNKYYNSSPLYMGYTRNNNISKTVLFTSEVSHLLNKYIKCTGGLIAFNSPEQIDEFINAFQMAPMTKYIDDQQNKMNLLK
jgi:hypothetical protein